MYLFCVGVLSDGQNNPDCCPIVFRSLLCFTRLLGAVEKILSSVDVAERKPFATATQNLAVGVLCGSATSVGLFMEAFYVHDILTLTVQNIVQGQAFTFLTESQDDLASFFLPSEASALQSSGSSSSSCPSGVVQFVVHSNAALFQRSLTSNATEVTRGNVSSPVVGVSVRDLPFIQLKNTESNMLFNLTQVRNTFS